MLAFRRYFRNPDSEWLVLLPGAGSAAAIWRRQIPVLRRSWNVLVIDLPGHGRSPHGMGPAEYSFEFVANQVMEVLDAEGVPAAHFVSMSLGALIAETISLISPARVYSLVLAGGIAKLSWWATLLMYGGRIANWFMPYIALYRIFAWIIMPGRTHAFTRSLFAAHARRLGRQEFLRWYRMCTSVRSLMNRAGRRPDSIPTLFVMGERDYMFKKFAMERARTRSDTQVAVIRNCGHVCSLEQPDEFNRVISTFLIQHGKGIRSEPRF
jgi:pimeloyl-ACP methyl ester carboxylesterase